MTDELAIGTLIMDNGKLAVVVRVIKSGSLKTNCPVINWRNNYELYYLDGMHSVIGQTTVQRLIDEGRIVVINEDNTPKPDKDEQTER